MATVTDWAVAPAYFNPDEYYLVLADPIPNAIFPIRGPIRLHCNGVQRAGSVAGICLLGDHIALLRVTFLAFHHQIGVAVMVARRLLALSPWTGLFESCVEIPVWSYRPGPVPDWYSKNNPFVPYAHVLIPFTAAEKFCLPRELFDLNIYRPLKPNATISPAPVR